MRLLLLLCILAATEVLAERVSTWVPRKRVVGWGEDRHAPALRIKDSDRITPARMRPEWIQWRSSAGAKRSYHNTSHEELHARIFEESERMVAENLIAYEKGETSYTLALNKFADLSEEERMGMTSGRSNAPKIADKPTDPNDGCEPPETVSTPVFWDWTMFMNGYDWPAKDMGDCGNCYAFVATGAIEAMIILRKNQNATLSEKYVMDCSRKFWDGWNIGCGGGFSSVIFDWLKSSNRGVLKNSDYDNSGRSSDDCPAESAQEVFKVKCFRGFFTNDEWDVKKNLLKFGPVATGMWSKTDDFHMYKKGAYDSPNCSGNEQDHEVLTVGYAFWSDANGNVPAWYIRNAWGKDWGLNGYFYLKRGVNMCMYPYRVSYVRIEGDSIESTENPEYPEYP